MNTIPKDILYSIAHNIDKQSFLSLSLSTKHLYAVSREVAEQWYNEEGSHPYAKNYGNNQHPGWMNLRIAMLAKKIWCNKNLHKTNPIQYKQIRPNTIDELFYYDYVKPKRFPANILSIKPNVFIFFSADGCRLQETQLYIKNKNPLSIQVTTPVLKEFSKEKVGSVIAVLQKREQWFLLSIINSSISVVFIDIVKERVNKVVDLKVNEIACHHYHGGILTLGLKSGLLLRYSVTKDNVSQMSSHTLFKYITSVASFPNGDTLATSKEDPSDKSILFKVDGESKSIDSHPNLSGNLVAHKDSIYLHTEEEELYEIPKGNPLNFHLISTGVRKFWPFGNDYTLMQDKYGNAEFKKHNISLYVISISADIKTASFQDGMLAIALEGHKYISVYELKENGKECLFSFDEPIHSLQFSQTLELIVTFNDGSISAFLPFKN